MTIALAPHKLRVATESSRIVWEDSTTIPAPSSRSGMKHMLQPRAIQALELALRIEQNGYNVYLSGGSHLGRSYLVHEFLTPHAHKAERPDDLIYLNNFSDKDKPVLVNLPAGGARKFKKALHEIMSRIRKELPHRFEAEFFVSRRAHILDMFQDTKSAVLKEMNALAKDNGFHIDIDDSSGLTLYPLFEDKRLSEEEFDRLDSDLRQDFKRKADTLLHNMSGHMRQLSRVEQEYRDNEKQLERDVAVQMLQEILTPEEERLLISYPNDTLKEYFIALRKDILENIEVFMPKDGQAIPFAPAPQGGAMAPVQAMGQGIGSCATMEGAPPINEPDMARYDVNIFVDNSQTQGAPLILEDHPVASNLLGCIERESEMGALITDFSLIKAGSLHKANGGYLIIRAEDILQHFHAWEGLLRALRTGCARMEDVGEGQDSANRTKGIEPAPVPLNVKIVLIGSEALYETLLEGDERFGKLFRIKAHLSERTERNANGIKSYLYRIHRIIEDSHLLPFDRTGLAWMVDYGSRLIEDQRKLSLKFPLLREIMIEASALAVKQGEAQVTHDILEAALDDRTYRANLVEEIFMEEYDREFIKVRTSGKEVGQVNGLSVSWHGDFEFGLPHQISCTVGVGHGGIIDLEREAELGGPIHTKAMMILKSYLVSLFARRRPIVLTGSLCFEQSYAGIEGDSASGAELVALLSAIAEVPVRLDLAFTGALSQSGQIMAVGSVTRKIEGFFKVCARHGLTGTQGVIIPHDTVEHLMLSPRIVEAVSAGQFAIYPVKHIDEALELLTNMSVGKRRKDDTFTPDTLYDLVDKRLQSLGQYAEKSKGRHS